VNYFLRNTIKSFRGVLTFLPQLPPSGRLCVSVGNEKIQMFTNQTNYVTHLLFWNGGLRGFEYAELFAALAPKINVFMDIGANIGLYSLIAAKINPKMNIVGFEPASGPLYFYKKNVSRNNFSNIKVEAIALSEKSGTIDFYEISNPKYKYLKHNLAGENNAGSKSKGRNYVKITVNTETLDNYVSRNFKEVDLIKIDTEGTEHYILQNADNVLSKMQPIIICETLYNVIESDLEQIMRKYGYEFYNHIPQGLKKVDTIVRDNDNGVRNCFFVHPNKTHLIEAFIIR